MMGGIAACCCCCWWSCCWCWGLLLQLLLLLLGLLLHGLELRVLEGEHARRRRLGEARICECLVGKGS